MRKIYTHQYCYSNNDNLYVKNKLAKIGIKKYIVFIGVRNICVQKITSSVLVFVQKQSEFSKTQFSHVFGCSFLSNYNLNGSLAQRERKSLFFFKCLICTNQQICIEVASAINQNIHKLHFNTKIVCVKIIKTRIKTQINIIEWKKNSIFKQNFYYLVYLILNRYFDTVKVQRASAEWPNTQKTLTTFRLRIVNKKRMFRKKFINKYCIFHVYNMICNKV